MPASLGMEIMAPHTILALNGSSVRLSCTFNSCYRVEKKQFSLNWTYQECDNCSEDAVSAWPAGPAAGLRLGPSQTHVLLPHALSDRACLEFKPPAEKPFGLILSRAGLSLWLLCEKDTL